MIGKALVAGGDGLEAFDQAYNGSGKQTDKVRVEANSSLSIIDKQNNKVYAFKQTQGAQVVGALVQQVSGNSSSLSSRVLLARGGFPLAAVLTR